MSWKDLPVEILFRMLSFLNNEDCSFLDVSTMVECVVVCKSWKRPFQSILYKEIEEYVNLIDMEKLLDTVKSSQDLGNMVKSFTFDTTFGDSTIEEINLI
jgi:hypothetical protein